MRVRMYKSLSEIERKLKQARYAYSRVCKFKGRYFVNDGLDEESGAYPLLLYLSAFIAQSRSVFQYAHKEAKRARLLLRYDSFIAASPIIKFFKAIRDSDIHEYAPSAHCCLEADSPLGPVDPQTGVATGKQVSLYVEPLSDLDCPKDTNHDFRITVTLGRRLNPTPSLIHDLEAEGKHDLVKAARNGNELYETQECEGESDLFKLCEAYISETMRFVEFGKHEGFIT